MKQIDLSIEGGYELLDGKKIPRIAYGTYDIGEGEAATRAVAEAIDALDRHEYILPQVSPADFSMLDGASSHFE